MLRMSKLYKGIKKTLDRSRKSGGYRSRNLINGKLKLFVYGNFDSLNSMGVFGNTSKVPCPCCGSKQNGQLVLNNRGKRKLTELRR